MSAPQKSSSRSKKDDSGNPDLNCTSVGNYVFSKTLGEGNFAKVKLAKHKLTSAEVAVKVIDKTTLDEKKLGKLYREVRIMKMLTHPQIVKLYEVIETKTTMFLVMEYSSGGELYDYLVVHGKMKEKEARAKFRQILSAVSYCHNKKVIHRDLKAENLLLDSNLDIKIADFGFSNLFDPDSKLDTFCGSPPYAAPELFQGRRYTGPEVDIWSLGVILYVLTTGCLPFDGKNLQEMRESVCKGKYRIPFYLSDTCEKLLRKLLIRDPAKRATLDLFIDDPWINEGFDFSPINKDISQKFEEDENIIRLIEAKYHVDRNVIIQALRDNVYDDIAAIYYLLYYERETHGKIDSDSPTLPAISSATGSTTDKPEKIASKVAAMMRIDEDAIVPPSVSAEDSAPISQLRAAATAPAKPSRRRFTVGTEADVQKLAEEDQESSKLISKMHTATPPSQKRDEQSIRPTPSPMSNRLSMIASPPQTTTTSSMNRSKTSTPPTAVPVALDSLPGVAGEPDKRKRHNTIVGIMRNTIYRPSESPTGTVTSPSADKGGDVPGFSNTQASHNSVTDTEAFEPMKPGEEGKPRSLRFTFNSNTTSSKSPDDVIKEVMATCEKNGITHQLASRYLVECHWIGGKESMEEGIRFDVEVCRLPRLKNLHGLRFKRTQGSSNDYKEICEKLVGLLQL